MKQVKIINGIYGHRPQGSRFVQPVHAGEVVIVTDKEAARLISLSVAIYTPVTMPGEGQANSDMDDILPESRNCSAGQETCAMLGSNTNLDIVDGYFTMESLMGLTRPNMEKLAGDLGVDVSRCKNKSEIAELLAAVKVETDKPEDSDILPELGAAPPVI